MEFDSKGFFFVSPRWGKFNKFVWTQLDDIRQPGFLPCLEKPTQNGGMKPTPWNSIPRVFFRFAPMEKIEKTRLERNWTTFVNPAFCPAWKSPLKMVVWNRPHGIRFQGFFFVSPRWGKSNKFVWTQLDDIRQPGFLPCLEKPTQNGGMKPTSWNSIARVFFRFAPMGKIEKTRFEHNWTTFVNPAFCPTWKSPLKMVVWNRPHGIRSQGFFFVSPRLGKSNKFVWTQLDDIRQPGFLPCLEKPTQSGGMKRTPWNSIPRVFFRFAPMGKVEQVRLNPIGRRSSTRLFALLGKAHSKWWYETDLVEFDLKGVFSFRPDGESPTNSFEPNWTTFVNPAFCPAWKRPLKMVVWNRPRGIRS